MLSYVSFSLHLSLTFNGEETKLSSITKTAVPSIRIHSFLLNVFYLLTWLTARSSSRLFFCKVSSRYPLLSLGLISWKKRILFVYRENDFFFFWWEKILLVLFWIECSASYKECHDRSWKWITCFIWFLFCIVWDIASYLSFWNRCFFRILLDFSSFFVKLMPWTVKACWICLSTV